LVALPPSWVHLRQRFAPLGRSQPAQRRTGGLIPFFNPSLEDCHDAPNSRWPWGSVALPECGRAFARSRRGDGGSEKGCCRRSRTHRIMRPQPVGEGGCPGLGPSSWQSRSISALALRRWGKCAWSLLLSHRLGPMLLSRSAPGIGFVRSRQRFVRLRQATAQVLFINRRPRAGGANSRRLALPHGPVIDDFVDVLGGWGWQ
jgi:hypothetical protein